MDDVIGKHLVMLAVVRMDCTLDNVEANLASIAARFHSAAVSPVPTTSPVMRSIVPEMWDEAKLHSAWPENWIFASSACSIITG